MIDQTKVYKDACIADIRTVEDIKEYLVNIIHNQVEDFNTLLEHLKHAPKYSMLQGVIVDISYSDVVKMIQIILDRLSSSKRLVDHFQGYLDVLKKDA